MTRGWQRKAKFRRSLSTLHLVGGHGVKAPEEPHVSTFLAIRVARLAAREGVTSPSQASCCILRPPNGLRISEPPTRGHGHGRRADHPETKGSSAVDLQLGLLIDPPNVAVVCSLFRNH
jgi:hypothetical protein